MRRLPRGRDDRPKSVLLGCPGKLPCLDWGPVGRVHVDLIGNPVFLELVNGFLHNRQITVAAHDNAYFFHTNHPLFSMIDQALFVFILRKKGSPIPFV